jgi:hypothetical protein
MTSAADTSRARPPAPRMRKPLSKGARHVLVAAAGFALIIVAAWVWALLHHIFDGTSFKIAAAATGLVLGGGGFALAFGSWVAWAVP